MIDNLSSLIRGLGHCSSLGLGVAALRKMQLQTVQTELVATALTTIEVPFVPAPEVHLESLVPDAVERRMSRLAKMCFYSAQEALGNFDIESVMPERRGLVVGTAFGNLEFANQYQKRIILQGQLGTSPNLFTSSLPSSLASSLSLTYHIQGPITTITTAEATVFGSFLTALQWIKKDLADSVLVVIGDEISDYHFYSAAHGNLTSPLVEGAMAFALVRNPERIRDDISAEGMAQLLSSVAVLPVFQNLPTKSAFEFGLHCSGIN